MGFTRTVPSSSSELGNYLKQVHENANHVKSVQVNLTNGHLEIDLDWAANLKYDDMYIPLKRSKINEAKLLVERLLTRSRGGFAPSDMDARELFEMVDPQAR